MISLKHPYVQVNFPDGTKTYGGNQKLHPSDAFKKDGCGGLAASDLILYLKKEQDQESGPYFEYLQKMNDKYYPYKVNHGTSGFVVTGGLNRYFKENAMPYKAGWGVPRRKLFSEIESMLNNDIPVILTVGPRYPGIVPKHRLSLYQKDQKGNFYVSRETSGHYMTITAINDHWMRVSSWGEVFYIRKKEYLIYAGKHSRYFYSNIIKVSQK